MNRLTTFVGVAMICLALFASACSEQHNGSGGLATVSGSVHLPAEGVYVNLYRPGQDLRGPPLTKLGPLGAKGEFATDLTPGDYIMVVRMRADGEGSGPVRAGDVKSDPVTVTVEPGKPLDLKLFAYVKEGNVKETLGGEAVWKTSLSGRITDAEGQPIEGLRVHVYDHVQMSERPKFVSARTGPDGTYTVALPEGGTYYLCARDKYGGPPRVGDLYGRYDKGTVEPSAIIVPQDAAVEDVDITVHTVW